MGMRAQLPTKWGVSVPVNDESVERIRRWQLLALFYLYGITGQVALDLADAYLQLDDLTICQRTW